MWLGRGGPASAAGLSRRVRMLPTVPDLPCLRRRLQRYQIGERYYPDWAPVLVHHRQAGSPQPGHPFRDIGDALVSKAIKHVTAQRLTYSDLLRIATLCDNPGRNIAARDHADQAVILTDRERVEFEFGHQQCIGLEGTRNDVASHPSTPRLFLSSDGRG